jgi:hypothetical protein
MSNLQIALQAGIPTLAVIISNIIFGKRVAELKARLDDWAAHLDSHRGAGPQPAVSALAED